MISSAIRTAFVFVLVWLAGAVALSHPVAQGAMEMSADGRAVTINARVSAEEELIAATFGAGESALASTGAMRDSHADYLLRHVFVEADGHRLHGRVIPGGEGPGAQGSNGYKMEFPWLDGQVPRRLVVSQAVLNEFEFAPGNRWEATYLVHFVNLIGEGKAEAAVGLLSARQPLVFILSAGQGDDGRVCLARDYLLQGVWHILTGFDHLLFIAGLALAAITLRDLVKVLSVFTLAHSVTLVLSILDILRVSSRVVEPLIAASIVFIALQNLYQARAINGNGRLAVVFFFGLFHGLGFAGGLLHALQGLSGLSAGLAIGAFSLGVECGHLSVVMPVFLVMHALRTMQVRPATAIGVMRAGSCMIAIAGAGYLIAACRA